MFKQKGIGYGSVNMQNTGGIVDSVAIEFDTHLGLSFFKILLLHFSESGFLKRCVFGWHNW